MSMPADNFSDRLAEGMRKKNSVLCVGLDPQIDKIPVYIRRQAVASFGRSWEAIAWAIELFNSEIIDAVAPYVAVVKPQIAFYEEYGSYGLRAYEKTIAHAKQTGLIVISDAKRGDGGDTAKAYASGHLGEVACWGDDDELVTRPSRMRADAMTVHGWIGEAGLEAFITTVKQHGAGIFVVDKTSFKPDSFVEQLITIRGLHVWQELAELVSELGKGTEGACGLRNVGVVLGATKPEDADAMRSILPKSWFLVPGYGAQGGGADGAVRGACGDGLGVVVNSSRDIIFAYQKGPFAGNPEDFAQCAAKAAEFARDDLNAALARAGKPLKSG